MDAEQPTTFVTEAEARVVPKCSEEIDVLFGKLKGMIEHLDEKVADVVKYHEKDFFTAFKMKLYQIKSEMNDLKERASTERLRQKQEKRLVELEKERNWFRKEALKLDKDARDLKRVMKKMKTNLENAQEDREFF